MTTQPSSRNITLARLNAAIADALLALWPEENKSWGAAFYSEVHAIESPQTQFRWLLGGIPILLRETFHSFLRSLGRPIGVGPSGLVPATAPRNGRSPRTPRGVLLALLLVVTALLAQSPTRAVFRAVSEAHTHNGWDTSDWPEVRRIQSLAEKSLASKNPDPELLAFASLTFTDENQRLAYADAAIHADPKLTWVDYHNAILPWYDAPHRRILTPDRIARLRASDPDNALLDLLRAESIALPYQQEDARNDPGAHNARTWGERAFHDPQWLAAMDAAFRAPRYDPYDAALFRLTSRVMQRYSINDPRILSVAGRRRLISLNVSQYSKILMNRASEAQRAGNNDAAIETCSLILNFAQRLRSANTFEAWRANDLESQAFPVLRSAFEASGQHADALAIAHRMEQNYDERVARSRQGFWPNHSVLHWSRREWSATLIQFSVLAIWVLLPLCLLSIALLWFWRSGLRIASGLVHNLLCLFADSCPFLLAIATAVLFFVYLPYDHAYHQALQTPFSAASYEQYYDAAYAPFILPTNVMVALRSFDGPQGQFLLWSALTAVLAAIAVILVFRLRRSPTSQSR